MAVTAGQFKVFTDRHADVQSHILAVQLFVLLSRRHVAGPTAKRPCYSLLETVHLNIIVGLFVDSRWYWHHCLWSSILGALNTIIEQWQCPRHRAGTVAMLTRCRLNRGGGGEGGGHVPKHRRRSWVNLGEDIFARKYMYEKLTKCPNFTWYLPERYFFAIFLRGMDTCPLFPVFYAYVPKARGVKRRGRDRDRVAQKAPEGMTDKQTHTWSVEEYWIDSVLLGFTAVLTYSLSLWGSLFKTTSLFYFSD